MVKINLKVLASASCPADHVKLHAVTRGQCWQNYIIEEWLLWQALHVVMLILNSPRTNVPFWSCHCQFAKQATSKRRNTACTAQHCLRCILRASVRYARMAVGLGTPLAEGMNLCFPTYFLLKLRPSLCLSFSLPILLYVLVLRCFLSSGSSVLSYRETGYNGCWGCFFSSEVCITGFRNASTFWEEIQNYSIFIAFLLMQKYEIQIIP